MSEPNEAKRLNIVLLSGVLYLDELGSVENVHWCLTADDDGASLDIQPVIRTGNFAGVSELLPAMLEELADRFAQAAAIEAAKLLKSKKKAAVKLATVPMSESVSPDLVVGADGDEAVEESGGTDSVGEHEEGLTDGEPVDISAQPVSSAAKPVAAVNKATQPAPSMSSLFDSLDMS